MNTVCRILTNYNYDGPHDAVSVGHDELKHLQVSYVEGSCMLYHCRGGQYNGVTIYEEQDKSIRDGTVSAPDVMRFAEFSSMYQPFVVRVIKRKPRNILEVRFLANKACPHFRLPKREAFAPAIPIELYTEALDLAKLLEDLDIPTYTRSGRILTPREAWLD